MKEYVCADGRMSVNGMCSIPNVPNKGGNGDEIINPPGGPKNTFEWNFDKVGDKVEDFNQTMKDGITSFDNYVQENLGIKNATKNAAIGLALGPMALPYMIGKNIFNQYQTNQNNIITDKTMKDPQGDIVTYDMMTYNNNQPQDHGQGAADGSGGYNEGDGGSYTGMGEVPDWGGGE